MLFGLFGLGGIGLAVILGLRLPRAVLHHFCPRAKGRRQQVWPHGRQAGRCAPMEIRRLVNRFLHHSCERVDCFGVPGRALPMVEPQIQIPARNFLRIVGIRHVLSIVALDLWLHRIIAIAYQFYTAWDQARGYSTEQDACHRQKIKPARKKIKPAAPSMGQSGGAEHGQKNWGSCRKRR